MTFRRPFCLGLLFTAVLSTPAFAQSDPIAWTTNIDAAKSEARQTGRLVLVHFWTEDCAPCMALERNVFNQPEVANALKAQYVPVKLNANDNPATAAGMGVTRVPTDIVITPDGEVISKMISPATPMAYVSELSHVVMKYQGRSGQAYAAASATAQQPQLNSAYAGLQVSPTTPPALAEANQSLATSRYAAMPIAGQGAPRFAAPNAQAQPGLGGPQMTPSFQTAQGSAVSGPVMPPATAGMATSPMATTPIGPTPPAIPPQPSMVSNQFAQTQSAAPQPPAQAVDPNANRYPVAPAAPAAPLTFANNWTVTKTSIAPGSPAAAAPPQPTANPFALGAPASPAPAIQGATPTSTPDPRQLPPGAMPLGFDGYCPVSMRNSNLTKWVPGNPQFGVQHRGRTYWFAGPQEKAQFWANPDMYAPALAGLDPVMFIDHRQQVPGTREHSVDYDNTFYMFASEASLQQFQANPKRYVTGVREAMGIKPARTIR